VFEAPDAVLAGRGVCFDPIGGMQTHTSELTRMLARRGVRQTVLTTRPPGAPSFEGLGSSEVRRHGLPVPWARQGWCLSAAPQALRLARRADLVHAHLGEDVAVLPMALAAARAGAIPLVVTIHTSVRHTYLAVGLRGHVLKLLGTAAEAAVVPHATAVIALTARLAERLTDVEPERLHVVPSGVVPAGCASAGDDPLPDVPHPRVLFVGRLHRQKGVLTLIRAAAQMRTSGAQIVVVGDGPEREAAMAAARRLGLAERVHFTGFRPHREIPAILGHADVFAMPSVYEELGSVLLEAMQAGLPIVASRTGGIPEAVGPAAELVAPGDAGALAAQLDRLLTDEDAAARLSRLARARALRYDWRRQADEVLSIYDTVCGRSDGMDGQAGARRSVRARGRAGAPPGSARGEELALVADPVQRLVGAEEEVIG